MQRYVLAITALLLSLHLQTSAQNRSPGEALKGLRDIGVAVNHGNVEGLAEELRGPTQQALYDRARNMLMEADIPLVESADDGKPRLVFNVTVNKDVDRNPAIRVDTCLTERVHLLRDQSKEMELVTWMQSGIGGPTVTTKMLFDVFDGQVKGFIKEYKENNPNTTESETRTTNAAPPQLKDNADSLQGLPGIRVGLSVRRGHVFNEEQIKALEKVLNGETEKKIKEAGIPILKYTNETEPAGNPILSFWVKLNGPGFHASPIEIESKLWQKARPLRDVRKDLHVVTWESQASDGGSITNDAVLQLVNQQVEEFIKVYTAANPKLSASPK